jgi:hypothetical protein
MDSSDGSYTHKNWDGTPTWLLNTFFLAYTWVSPDNLEGRDQKIHRFIIIVQMRITSNKDLIPFKTVTYHCSCSFMFYNIWNLSPPSWPSNDREMDDSPRHFGWKIHH